MMTLQVNQTFRSIQGEGYWVGTPAVFVRFQGCSIGCPWCDTEFAQRPDPNKYITLQDLVEALVSLGSLGSHLVITGGEPTEQPEGLEALLHKVADSCYRVEIETSIPNEEAAKHLDFLHSRFGNLWITMSPKSPVGMALGIVAVLRSNRRILKVVAGSAKLQQVDQELDEKAKARGWSLPWGRLFAQPIWLLGHVPESYLADQDTQELIAWVARHQHWRLSLQIHKLLGIV